MDGRRPKYSVILTASDRQHFEALTRNGSCAARKILHARILLLADQDHPAGRYHDAEIARSLGVHVNTVAAVRCKFVREGGQAALNRKARLTPPVPSKLDGAKEATLIAICCSPAPQGRTHWTMSLLAVELVKRQVVTSISDETVRLILKKTSFSRGGPSGSAFPRKMPPALSRRWSRSWMSTPSRSTPTSR